MTSLATALDESLGMRQSLGVRMRVPAGLSTGSSPFSRAPARR
jgi:hypothetical protein